MNRKELELHVLGTILGNFFVENKGLYYGEAFNWAVSNLEVEDFLSPDLRKVFALIVELHSKGTTREEIILEVEKRFPELYSLLIEYDLLSFETFKAYAKRLLEERLNSERMKLAKALAEGEAREEEVVAKLASLKKRLEAKEKTALDALTSALTALEKGGYEGITTGFPQLDPYVLLRPGEVTIIGARPSVGKTATAVVMSYEQMVTEDRKVLFFSMELPAEDLALRYLSYKTGWPLRDIKSGKVSIHDVVKEADEISRLPLVIYDNPNLTIPLLRAKVQEHRPDVIYIDYFQRIVNHDPKGLKTRLEFLNYASIELTNVAKEFKIPVVVLAQLNRGVRAGRDEPAMEHLKDTGHLEQDATNIILLHRNYKEDPFSLKFIVAKSREGAGPKNIIAVPFEKGFPQPYEKEPVQSTAVSAEPEVEDELFDF